jgi:hypothetical protein
VEATQNEHKIWLENLEERDRVEDLRAHAKINLEWMINEIGWIHLTSGKGQVWDLGVRVYGIVVKWVSKRQKYM